jgi:hypothetical protein
MTIRGVFPALLALTGLCVAAALPAQGQSATSSVSSVPTTASAEPGAISGITAEAPQSAAGATTQSTTQSTTTSTTQSTSQSNGPTMLSPHAAHTMPGQTYRRPTTHDRLLGYAFDTFGPYPLLGSALAAGIQQAKNPATPPEWGGGAGPYGERVASNFGINLVTQTTKYGLSEIFHEDNLYYRCECSGVWKRTEHALISTVTARRGDDGHRVFSFASLAAPYAGTEAAALLWYPKRYDPMDGFRMGNYNLLTQAGLNLALEFIYGGPHTLLSKYHVPVVSSVTGSNSNRP